MIRRDELGPVLRTGWRTAVIRAALAFVVILALGELFAVVQAAGGLPTQGIPALPTTPTPNLSPLDVALSGGLGAYGFHHVTMDLDLPAFDVPGAPFPEGFSFGFSFAASSMLGTALAGLMLFLGGREVARREGGTPLAMAIHGAKVALPYAAAFFALSFVVRPSVALPSLPGSPFPAGEEISIHPSPLSSLVWPLALGLVFTVAGGLAAARGQLFAGDWGRRVRGALAGGWRMTWIAVVLGVVGLLVLAAVHSGGTRAYFDLVGLVGGVGAVSFVLQTVLFVPNMAIWVAAGAAGGSALSATLFGSTCTLLSYTRFPTGVVSGADPSPDLLLTDPCAVIDSAIQFELAPVGYFLFLAIPLVAALLGGWRAARRSEPVTAGEAAFTGGLAGVAFALAFLGLVVLSGISVRADIPFVGLFAGGGGFGIGPGKLLALATSLGWGIVFGALGAVLGARGLPASRTGMAPETTTGPEVPGP